VAAAALSPTAARGADALPALQSRLHTAYGTTFSLFLQNLFSHRHAGALALAELRLTVGKERVLQLALALILVLQMTNNVTFVETLLHPTSRRPPTRAHSAVEVGSCAEIHAQAAKVMHLFVW